MCSDDIPCRSGNLVDSHLCHVVGVAKRFQVAGLLHPSLEALLSKVEAQQLVESRDRDGVLICKLDVAVMKFDLSTAILVIDYTSQESLLLEPYPSPLEILVVRVTGTGMVRLVVPHQADGFMLLVRGNVTQWWGNASKT